MCYGIYDKIIMILTYLNILSMPSVYATIQILKMFTLYNLYS
jgi:hypothetical protein